MRGTFTHANPDFLKDFGAFKTLFNQLDTISLVDDAINSGKSIYAYCAENKANLPFLKKTAAYAFDFASGFNIGGNMQAEIFMYDLLNRLSLDKDFDQLFVAGENGMSLIERYAENPRELFEQCFGKSSPMRGKAIQAFNDAMQGDACQKSVAGILINAICESNGAVGFFAKTFISPFMNYGINISNRHLNAILPMSTFNWFIVNALKDAKVPVIRQWKDGKLERVNWKDLGIEDTLVSPTLHDALVQDISHMGIMWTAAVLVGLGCIEPPDDDDKDKWCNVDEWLFCGQRISMNWWMKFLV